jgi:hypothetical protein
MTDVLDETFLKSRHINGFKELQNGWYFLSSWVIYEKL